jgi:hypothetical protein
MKKTIFRDSMDDTSVNARQTLMDAVDLSTNTTTHLLADIELLRRLLGIKRWLVLGGSRPFWSTVDWISVRHWWQLAKRWPRSELVKSAAPGTISAWASVL